MAADLSSYIKFGFLPSKQQRSTACKRRLNNLDKAEEKGKPPKKRGLKMKRGNEDAPREYYQPTSNCEDAMKVRMQISIVHINERYVDFRKKANSFV